MGLTTRDIARLEYSAVRLPLTLLEKRVVARYWDEEAILRLGFEKFLGSLDGLAGRLLADNDLSRRGQALLMRTGHLANADGHDAQAQLRLMRADEELETERATARRARDQATAEMDAQVTAAYQQEQEAKRKARRTADGQATVKKARAKKALRRKRLRRKRLRRKRLRRKRLRRKRAEADCSSLQHFGLAGGGSGSPGGGSGSPGGGSGSPGGGSGSPGSASPARGSGSAGRGGQSRRAARS